MRLLKRPLWIIICGLVPVTIMLTALYLYTDRSVRRIEQARDLAREYDRHYMLVTDDHSDQWNAIYECAREAAEQNNVYLEWAGTGMMADLSVEDCMRIAIASEVDGIILHENEGEQMTALVGEAGKAGIPVITVLGNDSLAEQMSYIGINSYQIGEMYGRKVLDLLKEGDNSVQVLVPDFGNDTNTSLMYSQMMQTVELEKKDNCQVSFSTYEVNTSTSFAAEEDIRDIFLNPEALADILICLDLTSTECALQALVDYNAVGNVSIIGYYASDAVMDGIEKGLISATLRIDPQEIGSLCIDALNEYWMLGHVSSYFNVSLEMISDVDTEASEAAGTWEASGSGA